MRFEPVVGDVQLHPDGVVEGWCWAPRRPRARLRFDLFADDRLVASGEASLPRPDLSVHGMSDTQHGFRLMLPAGALERDGAVLLSARERRSGVVFGRRLIEPDEPPAPEPALAAAATGLGLLSERLAASCRVAPPPAARLRAAFGVLGTVLPAHGAWHKAGIAAARRLFAAEGPVALARPASPRATLIVVGNAPADSIVATLRILAPATHAIGAEVILADYGRDARTALLPSVVPGLLLLPVRDVPKTGILALAAGYARGDWLVLTDVPAGGASLPSLLERLDSQAIALATAPHLGTETLPRLRLAAPSGVALAVRRTFVAQDDTPDRLVARLAGVVLDEPWPAPVPPWRASAAIL